MYYLRVTGQISSSGKRTEIPKTDPSYRVVPLSAELGQMLTARRQELEKTYGDLTLMLRCGKPEGENFRTDPTAISASVKEVTEQVPKLLRQPQILKELKENRPYQFNEVCQDRYLISMITCHALCRNFCSWLYCSGIGTKEVFRQMGHADKIGEAPLRPSGRDAGRALPHLPAKAGQADSLPPRTAAAVSGRGERFGRRRCPPVWWS